MDQENREYTGIPLIGDDAPVFKAKTTKGAIDFPQDYNGKWVIFFSHPADFTPVCTTEFIKCASMQDELKQINTELLGLSVDSISSHIAWLRTIEERIEYRGIKNLRIDFPVVEDLDMDIARKYGMVHPRASYTPEELLDKLERSKGPINIKPLTNETVRAVFIIDPNGKIRAILYYPLSNGRNMEEIKRLLICIQKTDNEDVFTPENWSPGEDVIIPSPDSIDSARNRTKKETDDEYCLDWFMCFRKESE